MRLNHILFTGRSHPCQQGYQNRNSVSPNGAAGRALSYHDGARAIPSSEVGGLEGKLQ
jgi:hypothetical protein